MKSRVSILHLFLWYHHQQNRNWACCDKCGYLGLRWRYIKRIMVPKR